ncbi:Rab-like_protein [Hexamita inflata]|uniref:Rab-like protein n=1 Tax=Hexamita inflata TaxID=28002 RepID=A0AA86TZU7_9EUKA|nr:Rab-like protein [Hexamita inflata]
MQVETLACESLCFAFESQKRRHQNYISIHKSYKHIQSRNGLEHEHQLDLNEPESLQQVVFWFQQAQKAQTNCTYILVGNKCDLERKCTAAEIDQVKIQCQSDKYYEVSAKDGTNIQTLFTDIGKELYKMNKQEEDNVQPLTIESKVDKPSRGFCC